MNKRNKFTFLLNSDVTRKLTVLTILLALFWFGRSLTIYLLGKYPPQNIKQSLQYIRHPNIAEVFDYIFAPTLIGLMIPLLFAGIFSKLPNRLARILSITTPIVTIVITFSTIYF